MTHPLRGLNQLKTWRRRENQKAAEAIAKDKAVYDAEVASLPERRKKYAEFLKSEKAFTAEEEGDLANKFKKFLSELEAYTKKEKEINAEREQAVLEALESGKEATKF